MNYGDVREAVLNAMNEFPELRLHRNRMKLALFVLPKLSGASFESITRVQRRLWSEGQCLPTDPADLALWREIRRKGVRKYKEVYG